MLTLAAVLPFLEAPEPMPGDLRDAPGALRPGALLGAAPLAARPAPARPLGAADCLAGARNLRQAAQSAAAGAKGAAVALARRRLAESVRRELERLRTGDIPADERISLLTLSAETELEAALMRLEQPKVSAAAFRAGVLAAVSRAVADLESAGKILRAKKA